MRFRAARPDCECRLGQVLASAIGPVRSQALYLKPFMLRVLRGLEPDLIAPLTLGISAAPRRESVSDINARMAQRAEDAGVLGLWITPGRRPAVTKETLKICLDLLAGILSPSQLWTENVASIYTLRIADWADDIAVQAVKYAAMNEQWRPTPVRLREIAVTLQRPLPSSYDTRSEIRSLLVAHGGSRAHLAPHSHPLIAIVADDMGGWRVLSRMTTDQIDAAFPACYDRSCRDFLEGVVETVLSLPSAVRSSITASPERSPDDRRALSATLFIDPKPTDKSRIEASSSDDIQPIRSVLGLTQ